MCCDKADLDARWREAMLLKKDSLPNAVGSIFCLFSSPGRIPCRKLPALGYAPAYPTFRNTISAQESVPVG